MEGFLFVLLVLFLYSSMVYSREILFDEGYSPLFGGDNLIVSKDGKTAQILLDKSTGAGFLSQDLFLHGFFSASIKLPADYTAGVVVAFYMSNGDIFEKNHDELDFEFLGNIRGKEWRVQTNVYGNGSTNVGREERFDLWFDPSEDFHAYSILWTEDQIVFYIDNVPIREMKREGMGTHYPSKPMSLYATIWDGSDWATSGGRFKVNYKYAPFVAQFSDLVLDGCTVDPIQQLSSCEDHSRPFHLPMPKISPELRSAMRKIRTKHMAYSYCYDRERYSKPLPECVIDPRNSKRLAGSKAVKSSAHRRHAKRRSQIPTGHPADSLAL
ncbi:hypothetical protein AMTRI_Chr04g244290 [Amborella trichopoda]